MNSERVYKMKFSGIYEMLVAKAVKKNRSQEEVDEVIIWLTGYTKSDLASFVDTDLAYGDFFLNAPKMNEKRSLIKGVVCGVRLEDIEDPLMKDIRYLDKLIDELAKGKKMDVILRK